MRGTLLSSLHSEVELQHAEWLADDTVVKHLTLNLDGWSNARMESIYSFNVIFPDRRTILLKSEDLSTTTHSGHNIAGAYLLLFLIHTLTMHAEFRCDASNAEDMARSHINSTCIEASVDVTAEEFDLESAGSVAEVSMPDLEYGNDDGGWDVADLLQVA
ncbi:TPA: hypothetical protein ACH3X1_000355 [Trebouxia sp. C0004]